MQVLLVEDDVSIINMIEMVLKRENFALDVLSRGAHVVEKAKSQNYDVIILDLMLPDMDGYQILADLRASGVSSSVLILSGLSNTDNKVKGLEDGADDYLTKPFDRKELVARIKSLARRAHSEDTSASVIETGNLRIEPEPKRVLVSGQLVNLTAKEYAILEMLALKMKTGGDLSKEEIMEALYDSESDKYPSEKIIAVFIFKLRKKLLDLDSDKTNYILTAWGRGYRLPELPIIG